MGKYCDNNYNFDEIYITQQFTCIGEPEKVKVTIKINSDISRHLVEYINLFPFNLRTMIDIYAPFKIYYPLEIELDPKLNMISRKYLLNTIKKEMSEEEIKK